LPRPTRYDWHANANTETAGTISTTHIYFQNPALGGELGTFGISWGSGTNDIATIVDDKGGSLAAGDWVVVFKANAVNNQSIALCYRFNCPAGLRKVTVTLTTGETFLNLGSLMTNRVATAAPFISSSSANPTGKTLQAGGINTGANNEVFFVGYMAVTALTPLATLTHFSAPGNDYTLWGTDSVGEYTGIYGYEPVAGTFNPAITSSRSQTQTAMVLAAFKTQAGAGGDVPRVAQIAQTSCMNLSHGSFNAGTTFTFDFPCAPDINMIVLEYDDPNQIFNVKRTITSLPGNAWQGTPDIALPASAHIGAVYCEDAAVDKNMQITLSTSSAPSGAVGFFITVRGIRNAGKMIAKASGTATRSVVPPTTQSNVLSSAIVVTKPGTLLLAFSQEERQTPTTITPTAGTFLPMMPDHTGVYEGIQGNHDTGLGHMYVGPGSYNFDITYSDNEGGLTVEGLGLQVFAIETKVLQPVLRRHKRSRDGLLMLGTFDTKRWFAPRPRRNRDVECR
jgi:hypothetical protein